MFNLKNQIDNSIKITSHNVSSVGLRSINITVNYDDPSLIKPGYYLEIYCNFSTFEKTWNDKKPFKFVF